MKTSVIDNAVQDFFKESSARQHSFVTMQVDDISREICTKCGRQRAELRIDDNTYGLRPCRGLVG